VLNPNICKRVLVDIVNSVGPADNNVTALYKGTTLPVHLRRRSLKPGRRALYLKYSIVNDRYYLTDRA